MQDKFCHSIYDDQAPPLSSFPATAALPHLPKELYFGSAGNVTLRCVDDQVDVVFHNLAAGSVLPSWPRHAGSAQFSPYFM